MQLIAKWNSVISNMINYSSNHTFSCYELSRCLCGSTVEQNGLKSMAALITAKMVPTPNLCILHSTADIISFK